MNWFHPTTMETWEKRESGRKKKRSHNDDDVVEVESKKTKKTQPDDWLKQIVMPNAEFTYLGKTGTSEKGCSMSVKVNNETFQGSGPTENEAKQSAISKVLHKFPEMGLDQMNIKTLERPCLHLHLRYRCTYKVDRNSGSSCTASIKIKDKCFQGTGSTKRLAKESAARKALKNILRTAKRAALTQHESQTDKGEKESQPGIGQYSLLKQGPEQNAEDESLRDKTGLRHVVIDGCNVARRHGTEGVFSVKGIKLCVDFFRAKGHTVTVFISGNKRFFKDKTGVKVTDKHLLKEMESEGILKSTPCRRFSSGKIISSYDDRYVLNLAVASDGIVVSNDRYRDLLKDKPSFEQIILTRVLPFMFVGDTFMVPDDPLGRSGPSLDEFLRTSTTTENKTAAAPYNIAGYDIGKTSSPNLPVVKNRQTASDGRPFKRKRESEGGPQKSQKRLPSILDFDLQSPSSDSPSKGTSSSPKASHQSPQAHPSHSSHQSPRSTSKPQKGLPSILDLAMQSSPSGSPTMESSLQSSQENSSRDQRDHLSNKTPRQSPPGSTSADVSLSAFDRFRHFKQLGLSQGYHLSTVLSALKNCNLTCPMESDDFLEFLRLFSPQ